MDIDGARHCLAVIHAGFPESVIEAETAELWLGELQRLDDFESARLTAMKLVRTGDKFPSLKAFRETYNAEARTRRALTPALKEARGDGVPEWVRVWGWARSEGETRPFPQQSGHVDPLAMMSEGQYDEIRERWTAAGCPSKGINFATREVEA
jgi:hypothetical protein